MKHAYLIMAHNEFEILQMLISAIDDSRNDIFIHFDKKLSTYPEYSTQHAALHVLPNRVDVRWADVSMIEAEFLLFEEALKYGPYDYFHLLSGVDLPIKAQNYIHDFFKRNAGKEFIGFSQDGFTTELEKRTRRVHLFPRYFRETAGIKNWCRRLVRSGFLKMQSVFGIKRNLHIPFKKGTQWVSVTQAFVNFLLPQKQSVLVAYQNTFAGDEFFIQTLCWNSPFRESVFDMHNEGRGCMRKIGWRNGELVTYKEEDYDDIMRSDALFARKFGAKHINIAKRIADAISNAG